MVTVRSRVREPGPQGAADGSRVAPDLTGGELQQGIEPA